MMPSATDWRSVTQYQYLTRLDRPGFGWEFLRRNVAYQEDYNTFAREAASDANSEARSTESLGRRWGLSFRDRSAAHCCTGASILAPGRSAHGYSAHSNEHRRRAPTRSERAWRCRCGTCRRRRTPRHRSVGQRRSASFPGWSGRPPASRYPAS